MNVPTSSGLNKEDHLGKNSSKKPSEDVEVLRRPGFYSVGTNSLKRFFQLLHIDWVKWKNDVLELDSWIGK